MSGGDLERYVAEESSRDPEFPRALADAAWSLDRRAPTWLKAFFVAAVVVCLVGFGYIAYRSFVNDGRCADQLGPGSSWHGQDKCTPPPVPTTGLMSAPAGVSPIGGTTNE